MLNAKYIRIEPLVGHTHRQTEGRMDLQTDRGAILSLLAADKKKLVLTREV